MADEAVASAVAHSAARRAAPPRITDRKTQATGEPAGEGGEGEEERSGRRAPAAIRRRSLSFSLSLSLADSLSLSLLYKRVLELIQVRDLKV
eukprot:scaffold28948_cov29-Tisochrysis_lutea.AAC.1